ncbi:hypothetical protein AAP_05345 [Ascosphaera apis ARSEF 7405]|uniref:MULE transposase domain-containing protein n=1 Tax=Ascosphaera apis ARSEF 7405 TaxID=392613 RepID=A0A167VQH5_9EURO|nr:hypothetical protein AAP_05345 [Ascosphaera apis ARSEF 7405]
MVEFDIQEPFVVTTDKDEIARNAIQGIFNDNQTVIQLCLWRVQKNVAYHTKKKWNKSLDGTVGGVGSQTRDKRSHIAEEDRAARSAIVIPSQDHEDQQSSAAWRRHDLIIWLLPCSLIQTVV